MSDQREQILARLVTVCKAIDGVKTVARNQDETSDSARPAILIFDGDEETASAAGRGRAPLIVAMAPQIEIEAGDAVADIGTTINGWRAKVIKALMTDATLATLCGGNGGVAYLGCATALGRGRDIAAKCTIEISITYKLDPAAL